MKKPIIISLLILFVTVIFSIWMACLDLEKKDFLSLLISAFAAAGALISAVFVVYGYLMSVSAFKEAQKPRILLQVHNGRRILDSNGEDVHQTIVKYANVSQVECRGLSIKLSLLSENEEIEIPRLFSPVMNMGPNDDRTRDFPTKTYFIENGIPNFVVRNLHKYKLRASYSYEIMGEVVSSYYDYSWDSEREWWGIA